MNKKVFKYVFMLISILMGAVTFTACSGDDDNGSSNGATTTGTIVIDGKTYQINAIDRSSSNPQRKITYANSTTNTSVEIETVDDDASFPTSLGDVYCEIEVEIENNNSSKDGDLETNATIKCARNGNIYQTIINNVTIGGHTVSVSFNDDISKYPEYD